MTSIRTLTRELSVKICVVLVALITCSSIAAYETWSENPETDTGNCASCHGKFGFVGNKYTSLHDGAVWTGDLMTGHGSTTMTGCMECHRVEGDQPLISRCASCHGREEDGGALQLGAGLVQRHHIKGLTVCAGCHEPVQNIAGENVTPEGMRRKGIDPCKDAQFGLHGLDNDGDGLYDEEDPDCQADMHH